MSATVAYAAATRTATLTPSVALTPSTAYTATVKGGAAGVKDLAGNALVSNFVWSFTTAAASAGRGANIGDPPGSETWIDTGATVTGQAGQLYYISQPIANLGLVAGQSIKLGDSETTYVSTWPGTDNLMQISPFVAVAVGTKVWRWG